MTRIRITIRATYTRISITIFAWSTLNISTHITAIASHIRASAREASTVTTALAI